VSVVWLGAHPCVLWSREAPASPKASDQTWFRWQLCSRPSPRAWASAAAALSSEVCNLLFWL